MHSVGAWLAAAVAACSLAIIARYHIIISLYSMLDLHASTYYKIL